MSGTSNVHDIVLRKRGAKVGGIKKNIFPGEGTAVVQILKRGTDAYQIDDKYLERESLLSHIS